MSADPYVYEGTDVLRNTADIRDPQALAEREQIVSFRAMIQMQKEPVLGNFDLAHYAAIHAYAEPEIFGDEWTPAPPPGVEANATSSQEAAR